MVPSTSGWHVPAATATTAKECTDACAEEVTPETPFQWAVLTRDEKCFCSMHVEQGGNSFEKIC